MRAKYIRSKYIKIQGIRVSEDFIPETFGRLTTIGPKFLLRDRCGSVAYQACLCSCGASGVFRNSSLKTGNTRTCGCSHREVLISRNFRHGRTESSEYATWSHLRARCFNPNNKDFHHYGGRGIRVCPRWDNFTNFLADMGPRPSDKHSIDRIDVNGHYTPENCRWATQKEQLSNTRRSVHIEYQGVTKTLAQWARELGMSHKTISWRLSQGWQMDRVMHKGSVYARASKTA